MLDSDQQLLELLRQQEDRIEHLEKRVAEIETAARLAERPDLSGAPAWRRLVLSRYFEVGPPEWHFGRALRYLSNLADPGSDDPIYPRECLASLIYLCEAHVRIADPGWRAEPVSPSGGTPNVGDLLDRLRQDDWTSLGDASAYLLWQLTEG